MDRRTKLLLWSLFQPEDSPEAPRDVDKQHRLDNGTASEEKFPEVLKSMVWIILSVLFSLTIAHLK
jgi:hypothetical protein